MTLKEMPYQFADLAIVIDNEKMSRLLHRRGCSIISLQRA
jgi:hypothetical protein